MRLSQDKKNSADLGGCYPPPPSASVDNTLLDLQNSSYPTQPHSILLNIPSLTSDWLMSIMPQSKHLPNMVSNS